MRIALEQALYIYMDFYWSNCKNPSRETQWSITKLLACRISNIYTARRVIYPSESASFVASDATWSRNLGRAPPFRAYPLSALQPNTFSSAFKSGATIYPIVRVYAIKLKVEDKPVRSKLFEPRFRLTSRFSAHIADLCRIGKELLSR